MLVIRNMVVWGVILLLGFVSKFYNFDRGGVIEIDFL